MDQDNQTYFRKCFLLLLGLIFKTLDNTEENDKQIIAFSLGVKLFKHLGTFYYLCNGTKLEKWSLVFEDYKFFDHASINAIARAALECYLTFFGLFVDQKKSSKEREFLALVWRLRGDLELEKVPATSERHKEEKKKHSKEIKAKREEIKSHSVFLGLTKEYQEKVLQGEWRFNRTWKDLAIEAGFSKKFFNMIYGRYSDATHSGAWSSKESIRSLTVEEQKTKEVIVMGALVSVMAKFLDDYWELFPLSKLSPTKMSEQEMEVVLVGKGLAENFYD